MALTATAQPVPARSWDEQIVPALRKRLEAESRMLTKRMSMISTHSDDDDGAGGNGAYQPRATMASLGPPPPRSPRVEQARQSPVATRPSAIPRPSGQYSRRDLAAGASDDRPTTPSSRQQQAQARPKRSRTVSTPGLHNGGMPTPASSRSNSPMVAMNPKPSRIPTPATPRGPAAAAAASPSVPQVPRLPNNVRSKTFAAGQHPPSPETSPDLFPASQARQAQDVRAAANSSHSSFEQGYPSAAVHTKLSTELMREPPPFEAAGRLSFSNDEGERPFEHWYRGEARRNGGVGEVRVARQEEMLEIATYGHRLGSSPPSSSSYANTSFTGRRRAGTIGNRESWFMDDDAIPHTHASGGVLDEPPLTDIDTANELSEFDVSSPNSRAATPRYPPIGLPGQQQQQEANQSWDGLELDRRPSAMSLAASQRSQQVQQQQQQLGHGRASPAMPLPRQPSNNSLQVSTVAANNNAARARKPSAPMSPAQQIASSAQRGRNAGANRSAQHARAKQQQQQKPRSKSTPGLGNSSPGGAGGGDEIIEYEMDAIPVWTQPKHNGNWDDVVLPAVAKKMGISDGYEEFDGSSPRPPRKRESSERVAPAPGTFGFDDTKYRRPQALDLDEFGRRDRSDPESGKGESEEERQQTEPILRPISPGALLRRGRQTAEPPPSPAPFSSYQHPHPPRPVPSMQQAPVVAAVPPPPPERFVLEKQPEEKEESGCCRCTIM